VAPQTASFGGFGGNLLVAAENAVGGDTGQIFAVSPTGVVRRVANVPFAEGALAIPAIKCTLGLSNAAYFTALPVAKTVDQLPLSAFAGLGGKYAIVPSEQSSGEPSPGLTLVSPAVAVPHTFESFFQDHQGAGFADCSTPLLLPAVQISREPHDINPNAGGVVTVKILTSTDFDPRSIIQNTIRYGFTGTENSLRRCDLKVDQGAGHAPFLLCQFAKDKLGIPPQGGIYRGQLILKLQYNGPTGDGEAEGGD
jgi:hypothetical protein